MFAVVVRGADPTRIQAASDAARKPAESNALSLQLALIADAKVLTLLLTASNISEKEVTIPDFMQKGNALTLVEPGGTGGEMVVVGGKVPTVVLKPGDSISWECDLSTYVLRAGTYRVSWRVGVLRTAEFLFVRKTDDPRRKSPVPKVE